MNAAQLAMITAYAQAQQIAGFWGFDVEDEGYYYGTGDDDCWALFLGDEGYEFKAGSESPRVPVKNVTHLATLIKAAG